MLTRTNRQLPGVRSGKPMAAAAMVAVFVVIMQLGAPLYAQNAGQMIRGEVKDSQTGETLIGANVVQLETDNGTSTNRRGQFSLALNPEGEQALRVTYVGYKAKVIRIDREQTGKLSIPLAPANVMTDQVLVRATRVDESTPITYENINREEIDKENLGKDVPYLIRNTPSVVTTSDAGSGIGYTGVRIRGVEQSRINVTINGIPLNDAESHGVFWVDIPDIAASVDNMQIQRGVGTSTNGAGAFGASMNLQTTTMRQDAYGSVTMGAGSFNTRKVNAKVGTGQLKNGWQVDGRLSKIESDGYIDRAYSDLKSYYLSASRYGERSLLKLITFSGLEETYQAWYGVPESRMDNDRTYNPAGMEKSEENPYENQTDNYQQDHYQLHYSYQLTDNWTANASLHYTYGRGYYEEYKSDELLAVYDMAAVTAGDTTISRSDLVRQLWLDNHFYGVVFSSEYKKADNWSLTVGGGYNEYDGDHYGDVIWAEYAPQTDPEHRYYQNNGFKTDFNIYAKANYYFTPDVNAYVDMQLRTVTYDFLGKDVQESNTGGGDDTRQIVNLRRHDRLDFLNPKAGLVYRLSSKQRAFLSFSVANKEPTRDEYVNSTPANRPEHETLYDWEMGYKAEFRNFYGGVTLYYMDYKNQLIPTGEINEVGGVVRDNIPDSYRRGIELQGGTRLIRESESHPGLELSANATFSQNRIDEYRQYISVYDGGFNPVTNAEGEQLQQQFTYDNTAIALSPQIISNGVVSLNWKDLTLDWVNKYVGRQYLDNTESKSNSLDPYWVSNLELAYKQSGIPFMEELVVRFEVDNLFNELYSANGYVYNYIIQDQQGGRSVYKDNYYYPQAGRHYLMNIQFHF